MSEGTTRAVFAAFAGKLVSALSSWAGDWSGGHTTPAADGRFSGPSGAGRVLVKDTTVDLILADDTPTADRVSSDARAAMQACLKKIIQRILHQAPAPSARSGTSRTRTITVRPMIDQ